MICRLSKKILDFKIKAYEKNGCFTKKYRFSSEKSYRFTTKKYFFSKKSYEEKVKAL